MFTRVRVHVYVFVIFKKKIKNTGVDFTWA